jgi:hypothetical protein
MTNRQTTHDTTKCGFVGRATRLNADPIRNIRDDHPGAEKK